MPVTGTRYIYICIHAHVHVCTRDLCILRMRMHREGESNSPVQRIDTAVSLAGVSSGSM